MLPFYIILRKTFILWMITLLLLSSFSNAQSPIRHDSIFNKYSNKTADSNSLFYVINTEGIDSSVLHHLKIIRRINNNTAIVKATDQKINPSSITFLSPANDNWKLSSSLEEKAASLLKQKNKTQLYSITADNMDDLLRHFKQKKIAFEVISIFNDSRSAVIKCSAETLFQLCLHEPGLLFADLYLSPQTDLIINGYNRNISNIDLVDYLMPAANGNGITIGIKERSMDETDIDLQKRIQSSVLASTEKDFHATTVSTLVGGAGNSFYSGKGIASRCSFFPSSFTNLFPDSTNILKQKNVTVQNHSYGTLIQSFYGAEAVSYDMQTAQNNTLVHVFSSGNRGTEAATTGTYANLVGFGNLTGNFKMAKNIITVAAVDTSGNVASFSSAGPLYDGRLGPQITALGPNGTSEAAAIVSGAVAVLQQVYKDSNAQVVPPASLIKAILFNSSDDIDSKGIDYRSGFGLLNIYNAVNSLQQKKYDGGDLQQSQLWVRDITIPSQAANLKITLSWTDTAGMVNDNKALVNDLDLEVIELKSGMIYKPWCLSTYANVDSLNKLPERKRDSLNTAEQVSLDLPAAGLYRVRVTANKIMTVSKQSFNIAYNWDTLNTFKFTNPVRLEDINSSSLKIAWKIAVVDTNTTGSLSITFDNGKSWQTIDSGFKLCHQSVNWLIPDTNVRAQLRMNCSFGTFYSIPFVIAPLTKINVDYLCGDYLRLSWQKNILAGSYQLYALGDSAFMKPISAVTDTSIVVNRSLHAENIYAVQPLFENGLKAPRSIALDVRNQGVNCYYKTIQVKAAGDSIELDLELSFLNIADSIVFEKVTAGGVFIRSLTKAKAIVGGYTYSSFDRSPDQGTDYYRAKLWEGGHFVYTEIVSIIHKGKGSILLFPNPVARGQKINFLVKETVSESVLQVMDLTGRVIGNYSAGSSGVLATGSWSSGIYFYRLISANSKVMATGKFIVE